MNRGPFLSAPAADRLRASDDRIVITGASGWIGTATLELLWNTLGAEAFEQRVVAFGSSSRPIEFGQGRQIVQHALADLPSLSAAPTLVLHLAFLTKDKVGTVDEESYVRANRNLSETVLAALEPIGAKAVFVASSGAAAYADDESASEAMRLYGSLKKADEDAFAGWAEEHGRRAVIARIFALSGPHINKHQNYALASFIKDAHAGRPIAIRAEHAVYRSYVAIRELMSLVFALMLDEASGVVSFSTGGERLEMQRIAEIVAETVGPVAVERPQLRDDQIDDYVGSDVAYRQLLSRFSIEHVPFEQQVVETAAFFLSGQRTTALAEQLSERAGAAPELADKRILS